VEIPLGNKAAKAQHAATTLQQQQADAQLQNLLLAADIDVRTKVRDVNTNIKRVEAARKNRELQEKNREAEQKKFDNGMSTSFTVLQIQEDLANAESQMNLAIIDYNKSLVSLERAKGTLIEARQIQVAPPPEQAGA
jgi:outer membrane protein TolC